MITKPKGCYDLTGVDAKKYQKIVDNFWKKLRKMI